MAYLGTPRRRYYRGLGLPAYDSNGVPALQSTALLALPPPTAGACPGSPGCPGYVPPASGYMIPVWDLPALLPSAGSNPNLPSGSSFTDWLNAHATAAVVIGGIAAGVLLLSRL